MRVLSYFFFFKDYILLKQSSTREMAGKVSKKSGAKKSGAKKVKDKREKGKGKR